MPTPPVEVMPSAAVPLVVIASLLALFLCNRDQQLKQWLNSRFVP
jgi:hypothetical protein